MSDDEPGSRLADKLRLLLDESLPLWGVAGVVDPPVGDEPLIVVRAEGARAAVRPGPPGNGSIRWFVTSTVGDGPGRDRPCTSVLGVLGAVRATLTGEHGTGARLRIGAGPQP